MGTYRKVKVRNSVRKLNDGEAGPRHKVVSGSFRKKGDMRHDGKRSDKKKNNETKDKIVLADE